VAAVPHLRRGGISSALLRVMAGEARQNAALRTAAIALVAFISASCWGTTATSTSSRRETSSPSGSPPPSVAPCPDPEYNPENMCLGPVDAGTYTTVQLRPTLTYTVPDGWANYEDLPGQFILLPPGAHVRGVDPGRSDYIGVYPSTAAPRRDCSGRRDPTVPRSAAGYLRWLRANPALEVSDPAPITIGSHEGTTVDVSLRPGRAPCSDGIKGFAEFAVGVAPADFSAAVTPSEPYRLHVFDVHHRLFLILVADPKHGGSDLPDWPSTARQVVRRFSF
jgi:hypothetical protein